MSEIQRKTAIPLLRGFGWAKESNTQGDRTWKYVKRKLPEVSRISPSVQQLSLRRFFPPVRDQGSDNISTAYACLAVIEYFEMRILGDTCERSPTFLDAMTREFTGVPAGRGVSIRDTLKSLVKYGSPPKPLGECTLDNDCKTRQLLVRRGKDFQKLRYARLDYPDGTGKGTLKRTKSCLRSGLPVVFGFEVHHLMSESKPFPVAKPYYSPGWQSVVACGYDDVEQCLLVRNSWGTQWGEAGYGRLPYYYVWKNHAADFWVLFRKQWLEKVAD